jgi:hypothetical protein
VGKKVGLNGKNQAVRNIIKAKRKKRPVNEDLKREKGIGATGTEKVQRFTCKRESDNPTEVKGLKGKDSTSKMGWVEGERKATRLVVGNVKRRNGRYTVPPEWEEERSD